MFVVAELCLQFRQGFEVVLVPHPLHETHGDGFSGYLLIVEDLFLGFFYIVLLIEFINVGFLFGT